MRVIDAVNYVRSKDILKGWSNGQIAVGIKNAIKQSAITWDTDKDGNLTGIVFGRWEDNATSFHVIAIASDNGSPKRFLSYLKKTFPNCKRITGMKRHDQSSKKEFNLL